MKPLKNWPLPERRQITGIFTDIDDTLTTDGAITTDALQAMADLSDAGLHVIPITGRPIGWCAPLAHGDAARGIMAWPVDAIVAENGGLAFAPEIADKNSLQRLSVLPSQLSKIYQQSAATRAENRLRMQAVTAQVLRQVPRAKVSQDSCGRETDMAIDHSEFASLSRAEIGQVRLIMQAAGMNATVSSIHINGWFGAHNKLEGARWMVRELFGRALDGELARWVYVGDSSNDQIMFQHFANSVGVANIRRFEAELLHPPRYITQAARGAGFAEVAQAILAAQI